MAVADSVTGRLVARLDYRMQYFIARLARRAADVPAAATDAENIFHRHQFSDVEIPPGFPFIMTAYLEFYPLRCTFLFSLDPGTSR